MTEYDLQAALDERFKSALESSNYRLALNLQKKNAKLKLDSSLIYAINGGTFLINQQLISFVNTLVLLEKPAAILLDVNNNPIFIDDIKLFLTIIIDKYYEATNEYLVEIRKINKSRTISSMVGEN